jgi:hypothetical protein
MNNERYNQIIDEAYNNWCKQFEVDPNNFNGEEVAKGHNDQCWGYPILDHVKSTSKEYKRGQINAYLEGKAERPFFYLTQEEFIYKIKTDQEFSERWGLKIIEDYDLVPQTECCGDVTFTKPVRKYKTYLVYNNKVYQFYE